MPYSKQKELPEQVRENLPNHAQEIYQAAYNSAWEQYASKEDRKDDKSREETAHSVAWAAVKSSYEKNKDGEWVEK